MNRLRVALLRMLGVVSPSGARPLPPRWALSRVGKQRFYPAAPVDALTGGEPPC